MNIRFLVFTLSATLLLFQNPIHSESVIDGCDHQSFWPTCIGWHACEGFYGEVDFLALRADGNGLEYGIGVDSNQQVTSDGDFPTPVSLNRAPNAYLKMKNLHTKWDPGFRIGIGYACSDSWGLCAKYTQYHSSTSSHFTDPDLFTSAPFDGATGGLLPTYGNSPIVAMTGAARDAKAKWNVDLNLLDVEIKKDFDVGYHVTLTPFVGIRTAWVYQSYRIDYDMQQFDISPPDYLFNVKMKNNYLGAGVVAGVDVEWELTCGFSIFSKAAASLLYGRFHIHQDLTNEFAPSSNPVFPGTTAPNSFLRNSLWLSRAVGEYALGLQWKRAYCHDSYVFNCKVLWEQQIFFGQNQLARLWYNSANNHDLGLSGFSFDFGLDF